MNVSSRRVVRRLEAITDSNGDQFTRKLQFILIQTTFYSRKINTIIIRKLTSVPFMQKWVILRTELVSPTDTTTSASKRKKKYE